MLRWTTLIVVLANLVFIADYNKLASAPTIAAVVAEYGDAFVPPLYAKALGAGIVLAFVVFYAAALWPRRQRTPVYDRLIVPLTLISVLASSWLVAFRQEEIALSATLVAAMLALAGVMFARAAAATPSQHSHWLRVPFGLLFGALTIAMLVAVVQWLNAGGRLDGTRVGPNDVMAAFLAIAVVAGGMVALHYRDAVYPAVIASAAGAIFATMEVPHPIASHALVACAGLLVIVGLAAIMQLWQPRARGEALRRRTVQALDAQREQWNLLEPVTSTMRH